MASTDRLRLYGDKYPGIPEALLRDLNRIFEAQAKLIVDQAAAIEALQTENASQQTQINSILARLAAAGIP